MKKVKLDSIGDIVTGKTPKTKINENFGDEFLFITPEDLGNSFMMKNTKRKLSKLGMQEVKSHNISGISVCIDCIGSNLGNVAIIDELCVTNQQINSITNFSEDVNPYYVYFYFLNKKDYLQKIAGGTSVPIINKTKFSKIEILLPDKKIQDEIANKLKILEYKISNNMKVVKYIQEYMQLIYYKWFVDFNFPNEKGEEYKNNNGQFEEIDGKLLPKNWKIIKLNEIIDKVTETINPQKSPKTIYKHYSIPVYDETKTYIEEFGESILSNKYVVTNKNLLVSKLNPWFKRVVYPIDSSENMICSTEFVVWKPLNENILEYLYVVANTSKFTNYCKNASSGTSNSHKRVNPDYMMKYKIPYNEDIVVEFNKIVEPMVKKINLLFIENKRLKESRDLLIKKLIK